MKKRERGREINEQAAQHTYIAYRIGERQTFNKNNSCTYSSHQPYRVCCVYVCVYAVEWESNDDSPTNIYNNKYELCLVQSLGFRNNKRLNIVYW